LWIFIRFQARRGTRHTLRLFLSGSCSETEVSEQLYCPFSRVLGKIDPWQRLKRAVCFKLVGKAVPGISRIV
jgi:hypothetical protein